MSTLFGLGAGQPQTEEEYLTTTSLTDIVEAIDGGRNNGLDVVGIHVANSTAGAVAVTVNHYIADGTLTRIILGGKSVPANDVYSLLFPFRLSRGDKITAQAASANALTVHVSFMQPIS